MSKNAVIENPKTEIAVLQEDSPIREAMLANLGDNPEFSIANMIRVRVPSGGATTWTYETPAGEKSAKVFSGILVAHARRGLLWPSEDPGNSVPFLVTTNMVHAYQFGEEHGDLDLKKIEKFATEDMEGRKCYLWQKLPYNQFGTAKGGKGRGKRCREMRILAMLPVESHMPYLVGVPPSSLKGLKQFFDYATVPHWRMIVGLGLESQKNEGGQPYSRVTYRLEKELSGEEGLMIKKLYTENLKPMLECVDAMVVSQLDSEE